MVRQIYFSVIVCMLSYAGQTSSPKNSPDVGDFARITSELDNLHRGPVLSAHVEDKTIVRDAAALHLGAGTMYVLPAVYDGIHALYYVGSGSFILDPPSEIERKQLYRFYENESFKRELRSCFFLFTDSTYRELSRTIAFAPSELPAGAASSVKKALRVIKNREGTEYDPEIIQSFLFQDGGEMFYCQITDDDNTPFYFLIDPYDEEEVSFGPVSDAISKAFREVVSQFRLHQDAGHGNPLAPEIKPSIDIQQYIMRCTIKSNLDFVADCTLSFIVEARKRAWIPMFLHQELSVDSITWQENGKVQFVRNEESPFLWIFLPDRLRTAENLTLRIYYHGEEIVQKQDGWYSTKTSTGWYPHSFKERDKAKFDLTFTTPKHLAFASIGERISLTTNEENTVSRWVLNTEHRNASFVLGTYSEYSVTGENVPPLTVYMSTSHDAGLRHYFAMQGLYSGKDMEKQVAQDVENSIRFFQHVYGKTVSNHFHAAEIPSFHGEAFPGLVHLSWLTFQRTSSYGDDEIFRAHEVAHQWWGVGVDFKTYHDQWLSEGFSEYSGLWYMQVVRKDNTLFFDHLEKYRKAIMSNRDYLFSKGQEAGPIWLGRRTHTSTTAGDYSLIIYKKGAWVLHMLRNMLIDLKTMNEDVFKAMMKDFFTTYAGQEATTENFKTVVEKHCGIPMQWFFKQWVYNTEIPTYTVSYALKELPEGKYKVKCTVKQANVPDDFQMYVPFFIDFGDDRFARVRYLIKGPVTEFEFPILPLKPEEIKFNDLESVLCEIEDEDWE